MNAKGVQQKLGSALVGITVVAYFARPWSCGYALSQFRPSDPVPYAHFDYHGFGTIFAWLLALLFAGPVFWLASEVFLERPVRVGLFGSGPDRKTTIFSVLIAAAIGAPMQSQLSYLITLPNSITEPILVSSLLWLTVVEMARTAAVRGQPLSKSAIRVAIVVALVTLPSKLTLLGFALTRS